MISTSTTIACEQKKRLCSVCKSPHHNSRGCRYINVFGWSAGFITKEEKKLNEVKYNQMIEQLDTARKKFEEASDRHLRHIEIMTNDYIIPYSSQNGNPPLRDYLEVYVTPHDISGRWMIRSNEDWIEHIQYGLKKSETRLYNRYGKYYFEKLRNCNGFVDKLNFTIKKSRKREKDVINNVNVVSKKHHLPVEIWKYIVEYVYTCPYKDGKEILYYEN
jgi:hypothetical protein